MHSSNRKSTRVKIGYHASHEQFSPSELLKLTAQAANSGFDLIHCSDHFHPWSEAQGQSGYSFAWLGAAMQQVPLPFAMVCSPSGRYHPAIVAQAIATLCEMFPGRLTVSFGSGEALNELITGDLWPDKAVRNARLKAAVSAIKRLLNGETVTVDDGLIKIVQAKLYTLPKQQPILMGAALSEETAAWMGEWTDGLITVAQPAEQLEKIVEAFRKNSGQHKPMVLKVPIAYAKSDEEALLEAHEQWRNNIFQGIVLAELRTVEQFDALGQMVSPQDLLGKVRISSDLEKHTTWLQEDLKLGFNQLILHQVSRNQAEFIEDFGRVVLPSLR